MKRVLLVLSLCAYAASAAQIFRVDPAPVTTTAGNAPYGGNPALYAVAGATISLCTDAACSTPATTYTDASGNTACPVYAPVTLPGTVVCTSTTGPQGQFGFWLAPGTYYYKIIVPNGQTFGNYPVTSNTAGVTQAAAGTGISVNNGGIGIVTITNTGVTSFNGSTGAIVGVGSFNARTGAVVPVAGDYPVSLGGTGAVTLTQNGVLFGNGLNPIGATAAGSQYQVFQAGASGVPTVGPLQLAQAAATTGILPAASGGTGAASPAAHAVPVAQGASPYAFAAPSTAGQVLTSNGPGADPSFQPAATILPAGSQMQALRIQPNSGNNTTYQFASLPWVWATDFNFPAQSCGVSGSCSFGGSSGFGLIAGNNSLTMNPVPLGVNGTDTEHYLYVSGGTGTAEACLITGGSGTSGQASGQIIINCANSHSGTWVLGSATAGIEEAHNASPQGYTVYLPIGRTNIYQDVYVHKTQKFTCSNGATQNAGLQGCIIVPQTAGQGTFHVVGTDTVTFEDFAIDYPTLQASGSTINLDTETNTRIRYVSFNNGYDEVHITSGALDWLDHVQMYGFKHDGVYIHNSITPDATGVKITSSELYGVAGFMANACVEHTNSGGLTFIGSACRGYSGTGITYGILSQPTGNSSQMNISGSEFDGITNSIVITPAGGVTWLAYAITGNAFNVFQGVNPVAITIGSLGAADGTIVGNSIFSGIGGTAISLLGTNWIVASNTIDGFTTGIGANGGANNKIGTNLISGTTTPVALGASSSVRLFYPANLTYAQMTAGPVSDGSVVYVSDSNGTCAAGGGTGRTCFRENGAWTH